MKAAWHAKPVQLTSTFLTLNATGLPLKVATRSINRITKTIKHNPRLLEAAKQMRRRVLGKVA